MNISFILKSILSAPYKCLMIIFENNFELCIYLKNKKEPFSFLTKTIGFILLWLFL